MTTVAVDHPAHDDCHADSPARQQTVTEVITTVPLPSSSSPPPPPSAPAAAAAASVASRDASKHRSSPTTDNTQRVVSWRSQGARPNFHENLPFKVCFPLFLFCDRITNGCSVYQRTYDFSTTINLNDPHRILFYRFF